MTAHSTHHHACSTPILKAGKWKIFSPTILEDDNIQVGVIEVHPSLKNRIAYATRTRCDNSDNLENELIVIQDFDVPKHFDHPLSSSTNGRIISCFTLKDLASRLNEFHQTKSFTNERVPSLSSWRTPVTAHTLGAVQSLAFLDRDAVRTSVAPGFVKDNPSRNEIQKLMIGFRRCIVTLAVFKNQKERYACRLAVQAYIGPDDLDEYESDTKAKKKQPASFAVPISEYIVAYGCYDGGVRFYDILNRKLVKAALGPNGRSNPIVRVMNANPIIDSGDVTPQTIFPKLVCACASGIAYLWELELSINVITGEILYFNIPPPLAQFDGMVAAVSGRGIPVVYPPPLSPTSIASLSPCSSWEQIDMVNAQFEISYDPHRNIMFWAFSPECIGASVLRHASREERLSSNGALVSWDMSKLPRSEWPPPVAPPCCVSQLPRTPSGRVSSSMVLPGILNDLFSTSILSTLYCTSSCEIVIGIADLNMPHDSIQRDINSFILFDLSPLTNGCCYSIAVSRMQPSIVAFGTQSGVVLAKISEIENSTCKILTHDESAYKISTISDSMYGQTQVQIDELSDNITINSNKNGCCHLQNKQVILESDRMSDTWNLNPANLHSLERLPVKPELTFHFSYNSEQLRAQMTHILEQQKKYCESVKLELHVALESVEYLKTAVIEKDNYSLAMRNELELLKQENEAFRRNLRLEEDTSALLADNSKKIEKNTQDLMLKQESLLEEVDQSEKTMLDNTRGDGPRSTKEDDSTTSTESSQSLLTELSVAKVTESSLRNYISLLEEDNSILVEDLEKMRGVIDGFETVKTDLEKQIGEQNLTIDSLIELLNHQKQNHMNEVAMHEKEIVDLKSQVVDLQQRYKAEEEIATHSELKYISALTMISKLEAENARLEEEALQKNGIFITMKTELQNSLNELAQVRRNNKNN